MGKLEYREARADDSAALCALLRETPMGRGIRICQEPNEAFFASRLVESSVWAAFEKETGRAIGLFSARARKVFVGDTIRSVRYLSDLRIRPEYRNGMLLARGFKALRDKVFEKDEWAQSLVLDDNAAVAKLLTSGRGTLPEYRPFGTYGSWFMKGQRLKAGYSVRYARDDDAGVMQELLEREGPGAAFTGWVDFRNAELSEYRVATLNREIIGMVRLIDMAQIKSTRIVEYSRWMRLGRIFYNGVAPALRLPNLPAAGETVTPLAMSGVVCRDRDPNILRTLLAEILGRKGFYAIGLDTGDPLAAGLEGVRAYRTSAAHYLVGFSGRGFDVSMPFAFDFSSL